MQILRRAMIAAVLAIGSASAAGAVELDGQRCILAAAEKLPTVPGLTVTASEAGPAQGAAAGKARAYNVVIEFDALKRSFKVAFDCIADGPGAVVKMRGLVE